MAPVRWTDSAWTDLEQAVEYIARDSPSYAASLIRLARDAARSLNQFAQRGRVVPELKDPRCAGLRKAAATLDEPTLRATREAWRCAEWGR